MLLGPVEQHVVAAEDRADGKPCEDLRIGFGGELESGRRAAAIGLIIGYRAAEGDHERLKSGSGTDVGTLAIDEIMVIRLERTRKERVSRSALVERRAAQD